MRKRIITALGLILSVFIGGAIYIIITIKDSRTNLDTLITLHQVQILRDELLIHLERVQRDLYLRDTQYARPVEDMMSDLERLNSAVSKCFSCHHPDYIQEQLNNFRANTDVFTNRVRSITGKTEQTDKIKDTISIGENLIFTTNQLITRTHSILNKKTAEILNHIDSITIVLYVSLILGFLMTLAITLRIGNLLVRPFEELLKGSESFSKGNLDYRIPENMTGEFSRLARSFNKMAEELSIHIDRLRKAEQSQMMAEVAAGLAHEIKNPLTGIKGTLEVFSKEMDLSEDDKSVFEETLFQIKKLDVLTKSFIEYARPPSPQCVRACINEVINNAISFLMRHNLHRNIENVNIVKELDESLPEIKIDPIQMQQVFLNLAINALDAMPEGGTLIFKTFHNDNYVTVDVSDTGHGLDEEVKDKIFQPFFTTKTRGLGIGLSISKRFIELHGGEVIVAKSSKDGTTFRISLPIDSLG